MGLHINYVYLLNEALSSRSRGGKVCTLGVMNTPFTCEELGSVFGQDQGSGPATPSKVFGGLRFSGVEALDVVAEEGADHLFDLNNLELPTALRGRYALVLNGGTLEHVFNVPNALANISALLDQDGIVVHILPVHGWVEHGFYQFSPTLMFDYYAAAGFTILASYLCRFRADEPGQWRIDPAYPGFLAPGHANGFGDELCMHFFVASRNEMWCVPNPIQSFYASQLSYSKLALLQSL